MSILKKLLYNRYMSILKKLFFCKTLIFLPPLPSTFQHICNFYQHSFYVCGNWFHHVSLSIPSISSSLYCINLFIYQQCCCPILHILVWSLRDIYAWYISYMRRMCPESQIIFNTYDMWYSKWKTLKNIYMLISIILSKYWLFEKINNEYLSVKIIFWIVDLEL